MVTLKHQEHKPQREDKILDNLETLETSGKQDTEGRQNIGQSRETGNVFLMFPVSLDCPMFCLPSVACVPDVSSVSRLSVVFVFLTSVSCVPDVSSVSRLSVVLFVFLLCLVFLMFPLSLDCLLFFVCITSVSCVPDVSTVSGLSVVLCLSYVSVLCS
jgi:hypothetical protein